MKEIDHKHIIKLLGTCVCYSNNVFVCMENLANKDLRTYLLAEKPIIEKHELLKMTRQMCSAIMYLAKKYIIHRDLCCKNVFIGSHNFLKLGNFGLAKHLDLNNQFLIKSDINEGKINKCRYNTRFYIYIFDKFSKGINLKWAAPEISNESNQSNYRIFSEKSDMWSFGVLLYELTIKGEDPYKGKQTL